MICRDRALRSWRRAAVFILLAAIGVANCAPRLQLLELPSGAWEPAADGGAGWLQAVARCPAVNTLVSEASLNGSMGGQRVRGRLVLGVTREAARLELVAPFGGALFYFVSQNGRATLYLTRENRVVRDADPEELLAALTGIPLGQNALLPTLIGCPPVLGQGTTASRMGDRWQRVSLDDYEYYLQRASARGAWRLVATIRQRADGTTLRAEYRDFQSDLPQRVLLYSADRFQVELRLSQPELNTELNASVFTVSVAADAVPMTLEELRQAGPLAEDQQSRE